MTFAEEFEDWLFVYKIGSLKPTSFDSIEKTYRRYIAPKIGNKKTDEVTSNDIMRILNGLKIRGYSFSVSIKTYYAFKMFYDYYSKKNNIVNIIDCVVPPLRKQYPKKEIKILNETELKAFVNEALDTYANGNFRRAYGPAMIIYLNTGLRLGELLAAEIEDYDSAKKTIHIHKDLEIVEKRDDDFKCVGQRQFIVQPTPKTETSNRILKVNDITAQYLEYYIDKSEKAGSKYILSSKSNDFVSPNSMRSCYYKILKAADIPKRGIHALRHTFATTLLKNGTDIKVVSKLLGHASVRITYDTYIHIIEDDVTDALDTLISAYNLDEFVLHK
ncbi:MAG: tyrosine-type recombinase/integrase [Ruminococcus sp.]